MHRRIIHLVDLDGDDLFQLPDLLLHLNSLRGLIAETLDKVFHISHFLLLILVSPQLLFTSFPAKHNVLIILHLIVYNLTARDFQRTVRHIIDKGPVMTYQHHGTRTLSQELFQPLDTLDVKVVGGLVEQQHVGFLQEDLRQFDTHTPTAGEFRRRPIEVRTQKTESHQRAFYLRLIVLSPQHQIAVMLRRIFFDQCQITLALVVRPFRKFLVHLLQTLFHPRDIGKSLLSLLPHRCLILQDHHLRQITNTTVGRHTHVTGRRFLLSAKDFQQRRLACPILSH